MYIMYAYNICMSILMSSHVFGTPILSK